MCKDVKITEEQLTKAMDADYQKLVQQVTGAVNETPDGAVIFGSEELVRDTMAGQAAANGSCKTVTRDQ